LTITKWPYVTPGIPDAGFVRGGVPLTKEEVRCLALCKARLKARSVVYDVGAGTGSFAVEAALLAREGMVYAVEKDPGAQSLILENARRFGVAERLVLVAGEAPAALADLPPADRIFIGGSGGRLEEILRAAAGKLKERGRLVVSAVTVETLAAAVKLLPELGFAEVETVLLTVAKVEKAGRAGIWKGANPVWLVAGERGF
jgi:cobalt-precorrin-6B (C15)-methyltransferase